jgi:hypothetical protein
MCGRGAVDRGGECAARAAALIFGAPRVSLSYESYVYATGTYQVGTARIVRSQ